MLPLHGTGALGTTAQDSLTILLDLDRFAGTAVPDEVGMAVRHVCGLLAPDDKLLRFARDEFDVIARDYLGTFARRDRELASIFLAYVSGFFHELRHAHDLLATTYGQSILFELYGASQNVPLLLGSLLRWFDEDETRVVPLPLMKGVETLSDDVRQGLHYMARKQEAVQKFVDERGAAYDELTVLHLLEASATNTQLGFTQEIFGPRALQLLYAVIVTNERAAYYLTVMESMHDRFDAVGREGSLDAILQYVIWSALQVTTFPNAPITDGPTPIVLFHALFEHVVHDTTVVDLKSAIASVDRLYDEWGFIRPFDMLDRETEHIHRRVELVQSLRPQMIERQLEFAEAYEQLAAMYAAFARRIRERPEFFFSPANYPWSYVYEYWPAVHIKIRHRGVIMSFMTGGERVAAYDQWDALTVAATYATIFMQGRHTQGLSFLEDIVFEEMREGGVRFADCSGPFG